MHFWTKHWNLWLSIFRWCSNTNLEGEQNWLPLLLWRILAVRKDCSFKYLFCFMTASSSTRNAVTLTQWTLRDVVNKRWRWCKTDSCLWASLYYALFYRIWHQILQEATPLNAICSCFCFCWNWKLTTSDCVDWWVIWLNLQG